MTHTLSDKTRQAQKLAQEPRVVAVANLRFPKLPHASNRCSYLNTSHAPSDNIEECMDNATVFVKWYPNLNISDYLNGYCEKHFEQIVSSYKIEKRDNGEYVYHISNTLIVLKVISKEEYMIDGVMNMRHKYPCQQLCRHRKLHGICFRRMQ
jgi:hypothetical protein